MEVLAKAAVSEISQLVLGRLGDSSLPNHPEPERERGAQDEDEGDEE